jgi:hypothetical protein
VDVDKARPFGMDEIGRCGHARSIPDDQSDEKHKSADPTGSMTIACTAAHQMYPFRNSSMLIPIAQAAAHPLAQRLFSD